ncbi:MAG: hypothetical protein ACD_20C00325G0002 [uncultured bacterium]|nr:MAG: hypothetical protein ACD_20C00325G0002 [uncultured bacterium]
MNTNLSTINYNNCKNHMSLNQTKQPAFTSKVNFEISKDVIEVMTEESKRQSCGLHTGIFHLTLLDKAIKELKNYFEGNGNKDEVLIKLNEASVEEPDNHPASFNRRQGHILGELVLTQEDEKGNKNITTIPFEESDTVCLESGIPLEYELVIDRQKQEEKDKKREVADRKVVEEAIEGLKKYIV